MYGSGRESLTDIQDCLEALLDVREYSGGPTGCPGGVGMPFRMSAVVGSLFCMSRSGRGSSRMSGSGPEALPDDREWSGVPTGCPGVVGRTFRMSGSGREVISDVQEWSGGPPGCPKVVRSLFQMSGSG